MVLSSPAVSKPAQLREIVEEIGQKASYAFGDRRLARPIAADDGLGAVAEAATREGVAAAAVG